MSNPVARLRRAGNTPVPRAWERAIGFEFALQVAAQRAEKLRSQSRDGEGEGRVLLEEALRALDHAHAELAVAMEELHDNADQLLESRVARELEWARYRDLFEAAPLAYLETDLRGIVIEGNRKASDLFNARAPQLVGKPLSVFIAQSDRRMFRDTLLTFQSSSHRASIVLCLTPRAAAAAVSTQVEASAVSSHPGPPTAVRWMFLPPHETASVMHFGSRSSGSTAAERASSIPSAGVRRITHPRRTRRCQRRSQLATHDRWRARK
jgi:PAS domain-containing protein